MIPPVPVQHRRPGASQVSIDTVDDRPVVQVRLGSAEAPAPLSVVDGELLTTSAQLALRRRLPLVWHLSSSGAPPDAGAPALDAWGRAARALVACSGIVPTVCVVAGPAVAGPALLLGLADLAIFVETGYAYISGPRMVQEYTGVPVDHEALGGASRHGRTSGVAACIVATAADAESLVADLLAFLPANTDEVPPRQTNADPADRDTSAIADIIPISATGSYDVRDVIAEVADLGDFLELRANWATNLVTGLATFGGRPCGIVANQPQALAGTLDIAASQKGARFVAFCDAFGLPLVTLVDTPGFHPGKDLEWRGMIRHGAQLAFSYARATVPRVNLTLRKSYGGAYIVMDSRYMGNDVALALPSAEIAVMGAKGAVEIVHRRADEATRAELEQDYEARLLNPYRAAERGSIDVVIEPAQARAALVEAVAVVDTKRERLPGRRHDNSPL